MQGKKGTIESLLDRVEISASGCWEYQGVRDKDGYGKIWWEKKNRRVHRIVFSHMVEPIKPGYYVLHKCDNPPCCNPDHLWQGTATDNMQDAVAKGRKGYIGSMNPNSKLTDYQVKQIHQMYASGVSQNKLSMTFNVSRRTIHNIIYGKSWEHLRPAVEGVSESGCPDGQISADELYTICVETAEKGLASGEVPAGESGEE